MRILHDAPGRLLVLESKVTPTLSRKDQDFFTDKPEAPVARYARQDRHAGLFVSKYNTELRMLERHKHNQNRRLLRLAVDTLGLDPKYLMWFKIMQFGDCTPHTDPRPCALNFALEPHTVRLDIDDLQNVFVPRGALYLLNTFSIHGAKPVGQKTVTYALTNSYHKEYAVAYEEIQAALAKG